MRTKHPKQGTTANAATAKRRTGQDGRDRGGPREKRREDSSATPTDSTDRESFEATRDRNFRHILTVLRVPRICEDKRCRRSRRCVGAAEPHDPPWTVPCYERHRDILHPIYTREVTPILREGLAKLQEKLEDEF